MIVCLVAASGTPRRGSASARVAHAASASGENARLTNPGPETSAAASRPPASPSFSVTRAATSRGGSPSCLASFMAKFACRSNPGWRATASSGSTSLRPVTRSIAATSVVDEGMAGGRVHPYDARATRRPGRGSERANAMTVAQAAQTRLTPSHWTTSAEPSPQ